MPVFTKAFTLKITRRPNIEKGLLRGGIEIPVFAAGEYDLSKSASGNKAKVKIGVPELKQVVANFAEYPGPVPVNVQPHRADYGGEQPGFFDRVFLRGEYLWGELDLYAPLFFACEDGLWRGFSVELAKDPVFASKKMQGWVLTAGVFTNQPAADVEFKVAATRADALLGQWEVTAMDWEAKVKELETKLSQEAARADEAEERIAELRASNGELAVKLEAALKSRETLEGAEQSAKLTAKRFEAEKKEAEEALAAERKKTADLHAQLTKIEDTRIREEVTKLANVALERGVTPAFFEGFQDDPVAWFKKRFVSVESMRDTVNALPAESQRRKTASSRFTADKPHDPTEGLSDREKELVERTGVSLEYGDVDNATQLRATKAAAKK